jgi:hypothetical protein
VRAIAHHQSAAALVALGGEPGDVGVDLGLQRLGQHPPSTISHDLIDQRRRHRRSAVGSLVSSSGLRDYGEHGSYLPDRRCHAGLA